MNDSDVIVKKLVKNIIETLIKKDKLYNNFIKTVKGYHIINSNPIKEAIWEDINIEILEASGCTIYSQSNGSHKSGSDISCCIGTFSNKSTKYDINKVSYKISSYRLTSVCSNKSPGKIEEIINEINKRKDFTHYSIIARYETDKYYMYDWYLIPSDYIVLDPSKYIWKQKIGKNKDLITGWETNNINGSSMTINFTMSSQLWITVIITEELKKYIVSSCKVLKQKKINYIDLYERES